MALPVVLLFGIELAWQVAAPERAFIAVPGRPEYMTINPERGARYFEDFLPQVAFNPFLKEKPADVLRVVALGGSSTAGYPFHFYHAFPERLAAEIRARMPLQRVEVINLGMTAASSHVLRDLLPAVLSLAPDAVLIYAGHNEYYGAFGAGSGAQGLGQSLLLKRTAVWLRRSKIFSALLAIATPDSEGDRTMMARSVGDAAIAWQGSVYHRGIRQFRANLDAVLRGFRSRGIPTYVATVASNLQGQAPLGLDSLASEAFRTGQSLMSSDSTAAWTAFERAKERDDVRFRAPSAINDAIRELATLRGATVVDVAALAWPDSLFTDHLHPTAAGHARIARAFAGVLEASPAVPPLRTRPDGLERAYADLQIERLKGGFPFTRGRTAEDELQAFQDNLQSRLRSGKLADSLAARVVLGQAPLPQSLLLAARDAQAEGDTLGALFHLRALMYWQPFNASVRREAVALAAANAQDLALSGEIIQLACAHGPDTDYLNALAAVRLRQAMPELTRTILAEVEARDPGSSVMLYNTARLLVMTGDTLGARDYFDRYQRAVSGN